MAAKVQIKNEKYMPYGGIYFVIREFLLKMSPIIDGYFGLRSRLIGYQYSEISLAMLCNFLCGGDRTEDIYRIHDMIEQKPGLRICSPDTVLRAMTELSVEDTVYTADIQWRKAELNYQQIEVTSLPFDGLDGEIKGCRLVVQRQHKGTGVQLDCFEEGGDDVYVYRAMLRNFYRQLLMNNALRAFGIWCTTRMKAFTAKVITVVARWTKGGRRDILTLYTSNNAYEKLYADYG